VQPSTVDEDGGSGVHARGDAGGALGLHRVQVALFRQGLLPLRGGDPRLDQDLLDDVGGQAALVLEDGVVDGPELSLVAGKERGLGGGHRVGEMGQGEAHPAELDPGGVVRGELLQGRAEESAVGAFEVGELDEGDRALSAALTLVGLERGAAVAEALVVAGELDPDLGRGHAPGGLEGGDLREPAAVAAVRVGLETLAEGVRWAAAAELVREHAVVLGASRGREGRRVGSILRGDGRGGRAGQERRRGQPAGDGGVGGLGVSHGRPCYTSARSSCKAPGETAETGGTRTVATRPRVLMLHTGGTLGMAGGRPSALRPAPFARTLRDPRPAPAELADVGLEVFSNGDSGEMQPESWVRLAQLLARRLPEFDGAVVTHGTDTLAYTASALSFLLPGLDRPVVLTGSQRPLKEVRTDARLNLIDAVTSALRGPPEVAVRFDSKLYRGHRTLKAAAAGYDASESANFPVLGPLGVTAQFARGLPPRRLKLVDRLDPRVFLLKIYPGLDPALPMALLGRMRGLVVEAYGAGNVPVDEAGGRSLQPVFREARRRGGAGGVGGQGPRDAGGLSG